MKMIKFLSIVLGTASAICINATTAVKAGEPGADIRRPTAGGIFINPGVRAIGEAGKQLNNNPHVGGTVRSATNGAIGGAVVGGMRGRAGGLPGAAAGAAAGAGYGATSGVINHCTGCHNKSR